MSSISSSFRRSARKLLAGIFSKNYVPPKRCVPPRPRLSFGWHLEQLESREVPATFYVAPNGADSANGDTTHPWQTIQFAANTITAGDTVVVRAGNTPGGISPRAGLHQRRSHLVASLVPSSIARSTSQATCTA